jgi:protein TonB
LFRPIRAFTRFLPERIRTRLGERATGIVVAFLLEIGLALVLLTLGTSITHEERREVNLTTFERAADQEQAKAPEERKAPEPQRAKRPAERAPRSDQPQPQPSPSSVPAPATAPMIRFSRDQMASADISRKPGPPTPPAASQPQMGPPDTGSPGDTPRVGGTGPNGEPLYAASWYREPYDDELRGYLSTARGPGWGMIACRTVPDYRVEDCVAVGEAPEGSGIARAVLAAAWQFRVRPPRVGGKTMVGEWVRIRIDYQLKRQ